MSTRRSHDSHGERAQQDLPSDTKKTKTKQNKRSVALTLDVERVVRPKGSMRDGPRDEKGDSDTDQSLVSPPASRGATHAEDTPKRGRGRPRKSIPCDTGSPFGLADSGTVGRGKGSTMVPRRTPSSRGQGEGHKVTQRKSQHPDTECNSRLTNTQSSDRQSGSRMESQDEVTKSISDNDTHSESVTSPPVRRRGRPRKNQPLETNGDANQLGHSSEAADASDTTECDTDSSLHQPGAINHNNRTNVNIKQPMFTSTPAKRTHDSVVGVSPVTVTGRKRGRPRKTQDTSLELSSTDVQCSMDKQLCSPDDRSPALKRKRGRPRKTVSDPVETHTENKQNASLLSDTSDEEPLIKLQVKGGTDDDKPAVKSRTTRRGPKRKGRYGGRMDEPDLMDEQDDDSEEEPLVNIQVKRGTDNGKLAVKSSTTRKGPKRKGRFEGRMDEEDLMDEQDDDTEEEEESVKEKTKQPKVDNKELRTCAQCKEEFPTTRDMRTHLLRKHHLIWTPGKPEGVFNLAKLFRILGKLPCLKCGKETRFPQYYKFHDRWCGREEEMTQCALCDRTFKTMYLTQHMRASHAPKPSKGKVKETSEVKVNVEEDEVASTTPSGRVRRKAATKAINHIKNLGETDAFPPEEKKRKQKYTTVHQAISEDILNKFREQLNSCGRINCCFEGCSVTNTTAIWASRHYHRCPHAPPEVAVSFQCSKCDVICSSETDIETHVNTHTWKSEDSGDSYVSDNDSSSSDPDSDSDASVSDGDKQTTTRTRTGDDSKGEVTVRKKKPSKPADMCGYPTQQLGSLTPQTMARQMFPSAYSWTLAFRKSLGLTGVWPEWRPKVADWTLVDDVTSCLPVSKLSPNFCVKLKKKIKVATTRLPLFDAVLHGDATFNVGGPVWAATWCPVPVSETGRQYLAVYCHRRHGDTHVVEKGLDTSPALLQIWDCGTLQKGSISEKPKLYLAVATDYGAIWDMAWCYNGAWDPPDMQPQIGSLPRLGLLALAGADGKVHILSVPQPSRLTEGLPEGRLPVYRVKSCLDLLPTYSPHAGGSQCLCVDWSCHEDLSLVAAGFADGTVALWDLHSRSSLLYTSSPTDGATLRAYVNFIAHPTRTTGIKFCPPNPQFLGTCSNDRTTKTWDTNDLQCPLNKTICSQMTNIVWPIYWSLTYVSGDDCYCFGHNAMQVVDNGYYGTHARPMTIHTSCIWDVSNSDWLNTVCSVSAVGEVCCIWLPDMAYSYLRMKGLPFRRFFIQKTTLEELGDDDTHKGAPQSQQRHAGKKSAGGKTKHEVDKSEGNDLRTSCSVSPEGGAGGVSVESNADIITSKCTDTRTDKRNNSTNKNKTKCANKVVETDGRGDDCVGQSTNSSGDTSRKTETPNCDDRKSSCDEDTGFCLVYYDVDMTRILDSSQERASYTKDMTQDQLDRPPWLALHKVCWNPNRGSHTWLATGGHAGLMRLRHITGLHSRRT